MTGGMTAAVVGEEGLEVEANGEAVEGEDSEEEGSIKRCGTTVDELTGRIMKIFDTQSKPLLH